MSKPSALKREHPALLNMKFLNFLKFLWVIFALLEPNPLTCLNPDQIQIRIRIRIRNTASSQSILFGRQENGSDTISELNDWYLAHLPSYLHTKQITPNVLVKYL
jgi:hypothetical protein